MTSLREELDAALRAVVPGPPPVEAVMRQGHRLRLRRRAGVAAGVLAVAVAVAAGYPALSHRSAVRVPTAPVTRQGDDITDTPPGPGAPAGTIAQGQAGTARWQVTAIRPGTLKVTPVGPAKPGAASPSWCFSTTIIPGAAAKPGWYAYFPGNSDLTDVCDLAYPRTLSSPVLFSGAANDAYQVVVGSVAANVTYVVVTLGDQQLLKLVPVTAYGARLVAYVVPAGTGTLSATAFLSAPHKRDVDTEKTAVPYSGSGGFPFFGLWLNPGQAPPPLAIATLASGTMDGKRWAMVAYEGPWGTCFDASPPNLECVPLPRLATTSPLPALGTSPRYFFGSAAATVSRVEVTLTDGGHLRVTAVTVGNEKLWALALPKGQAVRNWTAYSAAGKPVATGSAVT